MALKVLFEITAGTQMVSAAIELAKGLTPGSMPQRPKTPPFAAPWAYGNVSPQKN